MAGPPLPLLDGTNPVLILSLSGDLEGHGWQPGGQHDWGLATTLPVVPSPSTHCCHPIPCGQPGCVGQINPGCSTPSSYSRPITTSRIPMSIEVKRITSLSSPRGARSSLGLSSRLRGEPGCRLRPSDVQLRTCSGALRDWQPRSPASDGVLAVHEG